MTLPIRFVTHTWRWRYGLERRAPSRLEQIRLQLAETALGAPFQRKTIPPPARPCPRSAGLRPGRSGEDLRTAPDRRSALRQASRVGDSVKLRPMPPPIQPLTLHRRWRTVACAADEAGFFVTGRPRITEALHLVVTNGANGGGGPVARVRKATGTGSSLHFLSTASGDITRKTGRQHLVPQPARPMAGLDADGLSGLHPGGAQEAS